MPTDWPGVPAFYRSLAFPTGCDCVNVFTPQNRPPWFYDTNVIVVNHVDWWEFAERDQRLLPSGGDEPCEYAVFSTDPFSGVFRSIRLLLTRDVASPYGLLADLYLEHNTPVSIQRVVNQVDLTAIHGAYLPRGAGITFPASGWQPVFQTFPAAALPGLTVSCGPRHCIHDWLWGEPTPYP
jgi:hypothetical protein